MRECVGKSYYEDSVLVKCDCGQHIMEVFIFKPSNNSSEFELGIEWHSSLLKKSKFPDFLFLSYSDFELFVRTITGLANDITPFDESIKLYTMVTLKNNNTRMDRRGIRRVEISNFLNLTEEKEPLLSIFLLSNSNFKELFGSNTKPFKRITGKLYFFILFHFLLIRSLL